MIDILPHRGLEPDEVEHLKDISERFENVYTREGCISFVIGTESGVIGYHYVLFEDRWVETVVDKSLENFDSAVATHMEKTRDVMRKLEGLDTRKGNEYPYMKP